jgi:hypothetical protein
VHIVISGVQDATKVNVGVKKMKANLAVDFFKMRVNVNVVYKDFVAYTQKQDGVDWVSGIQIGTKKIEYNTQQKIVSVGYVTRW